ncbi:MAG TPA: four-helix bundle copper-binding protein [Gemmatimonadales bacterium]|nr:four-helix bundle copper-binding protein [Gemmatimonadales bacterium]
MTTAHVHRASAEMQECIDACLACHATCIRTIGYCLAQGGRHAAPDHIRLMADCVEMCQTCAHFLLRGSELHHQTCGLCAEVCRRCAESCEQLGNDPAMQACVAACRRCVATCERMAHAA